MSKLIKRSLLIFSLLTILAVSLPAQAITVLQTINNPCDVCAFAVLISNIKNVAISLAVPIVVLMIIVGGVMIMVSAGNENLRTQGKKTLTGGIIGLIIVFTAWVIVAAVVTATLGTNFGDNLWTVDCGVNTECPPPPTDDTPTT